MPIIKLTQDKHAIVDEIDYDYLMQWKWCFGKGQGGYAIRGQRIPGTGKNITILMHRLVAERWNGGPLPEGTRVDHKNRAPGARLDNRRTNVRIANASLNNMNRIANLEKLSTKYKGAFFDKSGRNRKRWRARIGITIEGKKNSYELGRYETAIEAAKAYDAKALQLFGEFALTNATLFPEDFITP